MRSGVSTQTYAAAFSVSGADADHPAANLADLDSLAAVCLTSGTIDFILDEALPVGIVGLCHHNAAAGATAQVVLTLSGSPVWDSGVVALNTPNAFVAHTPFAPEAPVSADAGTITLSAGSWAIGGVLVGAFWAFRDVQVGRGVGVVDNDTVTALLGADHGTKALALRTVAATRALSSVTDQDLAMDFLKSLAQGPCLWAFDVDDPTTFEHQCFLATCPAPDSFTKLNHPWGQAAFKLSEHFG